MDLLRVFFTQGNGEFESSTISLSQRQRTKGHRKSVEINACQGAWSLDKLTIYSFLLQAGVWEELCKIKDKYLKMLGVCISISRAYYSAELKALREDQKLKAKGMN